MGRKLESQRDWQPKTRLIPETGPKAKGTDKFSKRPVRRAEPDFQAEKGKQKTRGFKPNYRKSEKNEPNAAKRVRRRNFYIGGPRIKSGWTEALVMGRCCVCGKEATLRAHGLWWCEEHYKYVGKGTKPSVSKSGGSKVGTAAQSGNPIKLGLGWI